MSGNHYTKQVTELRGLVTQRLKQVKLLQEDNHQLRQKEHALLCAIGALEGGISATQAALESSLRADQDASPACSSSGSSGMCSAPRRISCRDQAALPAKAWPYFHYQTLDDDAASTDQQLLTALNQREQQIAKLLHQLGSNPSYEDLYSSKILCRALENNGQRAAAHLSLSKAERLVILLTQIPRVGVLLAKYDPAGPATKAGCPQQQLHNIVDELTEKLLVTGLWDAPQLWLQNMCVNVDTMQPEPYPDGWWQHVVVALQLSQEQKAALMVGFEKIKGRKVVLMQQHQALAGALAQLQQHLRQQLRQFSMQAESLTEVLTAVAGTLAAAAAPAASGCQQNLQEASREQLPRQQLGTKQGSCMLEDQQQQQEQQTQGQLSMQHQVQMKQPKQLTQSEPDHRQQDSSDAQQLQASTAVQQELLLGQHQQQGLSAVQQQQQQQQQLWHQVTGVSAPHLGPQEGGLDTDAPADLDDLDLPLMSCSTLAAAAVEALAADVAYESQQHQWQQQQQQQWQQACAQLEDLAVLQGPTGLPFHNGSTNAPPPPSTAAAVAGGWCSTSNPDICRNGGVAPATVAGPLQGACAASVGTGQVTMQQQWHWTMEQQQQGAVAVCSAAAEGQGPSSGQPFGQMSAAAGTDADERLLSGHACNTASTAAGLTAAAAKPTAAAGSAEPCLPSIHHQHTLSTANTAKQQELLLEVCCDEQWELERQCDKTLRQIKLLVHCMFMKLINILTRKQLALFYVQAFPFYPDALSLCEALDDLGWQ